MTFDRYDPSGRSVADRMDHANYEKLLASTMEQYRLESFAVLDSPDMERRRFAIVRHDIDFDPAQALPIAEIEANLGARATYMFLLTSEHYNMFDRRNQEIARTLASLGHEIALHFDAQHHRIEDEEALDQSIRREAAILAESTGSEPRSFSFHITTPFTMSCHKDRYGGLYNAYAGRLQAHVAYVSDSNGFWQYASWRERLQENNDRLQILTHPEAWQRQAIAPTRQIAQILDRRSTGLFREYCSLLTSANRRKLSDSYEALNLLERQNSETGHQLIFDWLTGRELSTLIMLATLLREQAGAVTPILESVLRDIGANKAIPPEQIAKAFEEGVMRLCGVPATMPRRQP